MVHPPRFLTPEPPIPRLSARSAARRVVRDPAGRTNGITGYMIPPDKGRRGNSGEWITRFALPRLTTAYFLTPAASSLRITPLLSSAPSNFARERALMPVGLVVALTSAPFSSKS